MTPWARVTTLIVLAALALVACGGGDDDDQPTVTTAAPEVTPTVVATSQATTGPAATRPAVSPTAPASPTSAPTPTRAQATAASTPRPLPTATLEPTATVAPQAEAGDLKLVDAGFTQLPESTEVGFGFVVENPNDETALEDSTYRVIAYDDGGTVLETYDGYIDLILPGERFGVGGSLYLPDGTEAAEIEVQLEAGEPSSIDLDGELSVEGVYYEEDFFASVYAMIGNDFGVTLEDLEVYAVLYDAQDAIIGGGWGYLNFVLADEPAPVSLFVASDDTPARVEVFPRISSSTLYALEASDDQADAQALETLNSGGGLSPLDPEQVGWAMVVRNPNADYAVEDTYYHAVARNADGLVIAVESGTVSLILPGETLGFAGWLSLPEGEVFATLDIQLLTGDLVESSQGAIFTSSKVTFTENDFEQRVTGTISSSHDADLEDVLAYAVCYNAAGEVIGGGFGYVDLIPAGGSALADFWVVATETPASVELYAAVSYSTDLGS